MRFTPRERAIAFLADLEKHFSEWMDEYDEFIDLKIEAELLLADMGDDDEAELSDEETSRLKDVTSVLFDWCQRIQLNNPGRSKSRNNLMSFLGGVGTSRWEIYQPDSGKNADKALNLRPIGGDGLQFDVFQDGDLEFVKVSQQGRMSLNWRLSSVDLDGQPPIYVGSIPAWQLELVCSVPSLEERISRDEAASRILDKDRASHRWQRKIVKKNRESIALFFDDQETFFANPVILHDPQSEFIKYTQNRDGTTDVAISLSFFNDRSSIKMVDDQRSDSRPITIIDGQHRIRGAALSPKNYGQRLMVVLLPSEIPEPTAGKLFAEINTLSQPLKSKHNLFLAHRFQVSSPDPIFTFAAYDPDNDRTLRDRANAMSYEFAARLSKSDDCPLLRKRIRFLDQNPTTLFDIEKWLEFTYGWFQNYPYTEQSQLDDDQIMQELCNYFQAWYDLIGENAWDRSPTCLFRTTTQFRVILKRFEQVRLKASGGQTEAIPLSRFKEALSPLENIPFTNSDVFGYYNASGEDPWKLLDAWVNDALNQRSSSSEEDIMDEDLRGVAGSGIISMPPSAETHRLDVPPGGLYPTRAGKAGQREIIVHRPANCGYTCNVRVGIGDELFNGVSLKSKMVLESESIPIKLTKDIENIDSGLYMEFEWETIRGKVVNTIEIN